MREMDRALLVQAVALAQMHCSRLVLPHPVQCHDDGAFEWRGEEHRSRMRPVMLRALDFSLISQVIPDLRIDRKLVMHKGRYVVLENPTRPRPIIDDLVP